MTSWRHGGESGEFWLPMTVWKWRSKDMERPLGAA